MKVRQYVENGLPSVDQIFDLYDSVGWSIYTKRIDCLYLGLKQSLYRLAVYEDEKLIALIRAVGDGQTIVFIQDLLVDPIYQRQGIGRELIKRVLDKYKDVYQIHLLTDRSSQQANAFYQAMKFTPVGEVDCVAYTYVK